MESVLDLLKAHGIQTMVAHEAPGDLQTFQIDSVSTSERQYQGHQAQEVWGRYGPPREADPVPGAIMVPMEQPLARVVFHLLEPRSDDGLVAWGLIGEYLEAGGEYPISRAVPGGGPALSFDPDRRRKSP
jgi:hypothetical protein